MSCRLELYGDSSEPGAGRQHAVRLCMWRGYEGTERLLVVASIGRHRLRVRVLLPLAVSVLRSHLLSHFNVCQQSLMPQTAAVSTPASALFSMSSQALSGATLPTVMLPAVSPEALSTAPVSASTLPVALSDTGRVPDSAVSAQRPQVSALNTDFSFISSSFLRATAECFACLCHRLGVCPSVCLSVCPSVRLSHSWFVSKL